MNNTVEPVLNRRSFLKTAAGRAGLVIGVQLLPGCALPEDPTRTGKPAGQSWSPGVFVAIDETGTVTITCHRSEMGQQIRTSIAQIVADELEADWDKVVVAQATGDPKYGDQNTDGSRSVRRNLTRLRQAGAAARQLLEQAAAEQWQVAAGECKADLHVVVHQPSGRRLAYGDLVPAAAQLSLPAPETVILKSRRDWRYIGKGQTSVDMASVLQGRAIYGYDVQLPGMKVAVIARPPTLFGKAESVDRTAALEVAGVEQVVELPVLTPPAAFKALGGVAVVASNSWAAIRGREALVVDWNAGANADYDSRAYGEALLASAHRPGRPVRNEGDVDTALRGAAKKVKAEYYVPHLSQAPMEPPCATAQVTATTAEVWACTQTPQATRRSVAQALGFEEQQVTVNVTLLGGGFGRKSKPDFAVEAALLAREVGAPVKVMWTREDDIRNGYLHSVSAQCIEAGLDERGKAVAWKHCTVFPSISATFAQGTKSASAGEMRLGFVDNPFDIPNMRLENGEAEAHVRIGWLRAVANVYHAFATQSFACELAVAAGRDPKDYLLELIGAPRLVDLAAKGVEYDNYGDPIETYPIDTGRLANVVKIAAERADWSRPRPAGSGLGIAVHRSFLSYVATVVEVTVDAEGALTIPATYVAIDAGTVVNPEHVRAQCEGGSIYGLSCALGEITAKDGAIEQGNYNDFLVARMDEAPYKIDVHIVDSDAPPGGVGEPPTPPFAPALCNAIHAATGKRIRRLPIGNQLQA
ncbi:xanthine dehydrogenase family protein molybdopterin-binding subunit [Exilibacterium tricleocarpae]|uniref:Xanthine dehydrogenase family protein molybdopterin-binding subunit n=1 Tax=Exilibacterium tricleocarpae TaxID=2591008 RepID=A0A545U9J6_9GAMM|nr:molybdopterin cofactor-binding domain-containing protein [Exilibacterium tricleocarpae]TQV86083.1 xanthine dehydrogenase family protein molybdopterin-binding subunit [Exilibacterium tricleocarpae]